MNQSNAIIKAIKVIGGILLSGILAPIQGLFEILSRIPGLGRIEGKGAEKIAELRNSLMGCRSGAAAPPAASRVDIDFAHSTRRGRITGAFFLLVFIIIAVVCFCTSRILFGLLSAFAALCALFWPYMKEVENKPPSPDDAAGR